MRGSLPGALDGRDAEWAACAVGAAAPMAPRGGTTWRGVLRRIGASTRPFPEVRAGN